MATNNKQIAAQLQALSSALLSMEDEELLPVILDTCGGLMTEVGSRRPAAERMDPVDLAGYTAAYAAISAHIGRFAGELQARDLAGVPEGSLEDAMAKLESLREENTRMQVRRTQVETDIRNQTAANDALESTVRENRDKLNRLQDFYRTLEEMDQACSPEVIERQQQENSELLAEVNTHNDTLKKLQTEKHELDAKHSEILKKISDAQNAIDAIPAENARLVQEYDARVRELTRLQNAQMECSEEKQEQLAAQIAQLKPQVEKLESKIEKLRNHHNQIKGAKTELDRENQILQTDLLDILQESMGELTLLMEEHRQVLSEVRKQADTYRTSLAQSQQLRSGYAQWLGSDRIQLEANLAALDRQENTRLRETLDVNAQDQVREQFRRAEQALQEIDRFLQRCREAAQKDLANVERLAGGR